MDIKTCPRCGASEASRSYNYGWFVTFSCGSTHFFEKDGREISGGDIPKQSRLCMEAELRLSRSEVKRLAERVAALEDAERVAWALARMLRWQLSDMIDAPLTLGVSDDGFWILARGENSRQRGYLREVCGRADAFPRLTPDARAAIDAARKESERG